MNEVLEQCVYFGFVITIVMYVIGMKIKMRFPRLWVNPFLMASGMIIVILLVCNIEYETYNEGAKYVSYFLTPVTVCLAVPLYKQIHLLRKHAIAVLVSILSGCVAHMGILLVLAAVLHVDHVLIRSFLSKSVTTAIAIGVTEEIGGIPSITVVGVTIAGMIGAILGPTILRMVRIYNPIAQGLAIGTASHALGTSRMVEEGEIQGAMSSLAIVVAGILTVIIVPFIEAYL